MEIACLLRSSSALENLKEISYPELIDRLAESTNLYLRLMSEGIHSDEYYEARYRMEQLIREIRSRTNKPVKIEVTK